MTSAILGTGSALPEKIVTNDDLTEFLDTSDEWISDRTGIRKRHLAVDENTTTLSIAAANEALKDANIRQKSLTLLSLQL